MWQKVKTELMEVVMLSDKFYSKGIIFGTVIGIILLTVIIWLIPENMYFDGEYPSWIQQKDYTHSYDDKSQIIFLGDSAFKAAVIPAMISDDAYNLALGGAGPIEMYYSLKNYLQNHPKPKKVFISFGPMHFIYLQRYRDRALYFHFLSPIETIESQHNIFKYDKFSIKDRISMWAENFRLMTKFPTEYFQTIKRSQLARGNINKENYQQVALERGHMFFGRDSHWTEHVIPHDQMLVDFKLLNSLDFYMHRLLNLCFENDIPVQMIQTPINHITYDIVQQHDYIVPYQNYLRNLSNDTGVEIETELVFYDTELFGDMMHLNERGAKIYTENLKKNLLNRID